MTQIPELLASLAERRPGRQTGKLRKTEGEGGRGGEVKGGDFDKAEKSRAGTDGHYRPFSAKKSRCPRDSEKGNLNDAVMQGCPYRGCDCVNVYANEFPRDNLN